MVFSVSFHCVSSEHSFRLSSLVSNQGCLSSKEASFVSFVYPILLSLGSCFFFPFSNWVIHEILQLLKAISTTCIVFNTWKVMKYLNLHVLFNNFFLSFIWMSPHIICKAYFIRSPVIPTVAAVAEWAIVHMRKATFDKVERHDHSNFCL